MSLVTILIIGFFALSAVVTIVVVAACALSSQTSQELEGWVSEEVEVDYGAADFAEEAV